MNTYTIGQHVEILGRKLTVTHVLDYPASQNVVLIGEDGRYEQHTGEFLDELQEFSDYYTFFVETA